MAKTYMVTLRISEDEKSYLDSEVKRLRMLTGEAESVSDIIRQGIRAYQEQQKRGKKDKAPK